MFLQCVSTVIIVYIIISLLNSYLYIHWILDNWNKYYYYYKYTSIISKHLAIRGNKKILHTPPPHISSSEEKQINQPSPNHTYTKSTPNNIHHHYASSVTSTHNIPSTAHTLSPQELWTDTAGVTELLARWMEKMAGAKIVLPPTLSRVILYIIIIICMYVQH